MILNDIQTMRDRLRKAVEGDRHWVFLSDCDRGLRQLGQMTLSVYLACRMAGMQDEAIVAVVDWGRCNFHNMPSGVKAKLTMVTFPKSLVGAAEVNAFLEMAGYQGQGIAADDGQQDVFMICGQPWGPAACQAFLLSVVARPQDN
jgi:hypothetical protein